MEFLDRQEFWMIWKGAVKMNRHGLNDEVKVNTDDCDT